jgi:glycine oxidase
VAVKGAPAADVIVVGAGVIGAACAYELARSGHRVTVVERAQPAAEASGASAGLLSAFTGERADPLATLCRRSRDLYAPLAAALLDESRIDVHHERAGHLELCLGDHETRWARKLAAECADGPEPVTFLDEAGLRELEPGITREARGGLLLPANQWIHPARLVAALVEAATRRGARFVLGRSVDALVMAGGSVTGVRVAGEGPLPAGAVVLAAGIGCDAIAGVPPALRIRPVKGQILALAHKPPLIRHAILRDDIYLVPRRVGECVVGATVEDGVADHVVTAGAIAGLLAAAVATVPALARAPFVRASVGLRPASPDGLPVVGPWPDRPGLHVATGHNRSGVLLAPITAAIVRGGIVDGRVPPEAAGFSPDRLAT